MDVIPLILRDKTIDLTDVNDLFRSNFVNVKCCDHEIYEAVKKWALDSNAEVENQICFSMIGVTPLGLIHCHKRWSNRNERFEMYRVFLPARQYKNHQHIFNRRKWAIYTKCVDASAPDMPLKPLFYSSKVLDQNMTSSNIHQECVDMMMTLSRDPVTEARSVHLENAVDKKDLCMILEDIPPVSIVKKGNSTVRADNSSLKRPSAPPKSASTDHPSKKHQESTSIDKGKLQSKVCKIPIFEPNPEPEPLPEPEVYGDAGHITISASSSLDRMAESSMEEETAEETQKSVRTGEFLGGLPNDESTSKAPFGSREFEDVRGRMATFLQKLPKMAKTLQKDWDKFEDGQGPMLERFLNNSHGLREGAERDVQYHAKRNLTKSLNEMLYRRGLKEALMLTRLCLNRLNCAVDSTVFLGTQSILNDVDVDSVVSMAQNLVDSGALKVDHPGSKEFIEKLDFWKSLRAEHRGSNTFIAKTVKEVLECRPIMSNDGKTPHEEDNDDYARILSIIDKFALDEE